LKKKLQKIIKGRCCSRLRIFYFVFSGARAVCSFWVIKEKNLKGPRKPALITCRENLLRGFLSKRGHGNEKQIVQQQQVREVKERICFLKGRRRSGAALVCPVVEGCAAMSDDMAFLLKPGVLM